MHTFSSFEFEVSLWIFPIALYYFGPRTGFQNLSFGPKAFFVFHIRQWPNSRNSEVRPFVFPWFPHQR